MRLLPALLLLGLTLTARAQDPVVRLTRSDGTTVDGALVEIDARAYRLALEDGGTVDVPLEAVDAVDVLPLEPPPSPKVPDAVARTLDRSAR